MAARIVSKAAARAKYPSTVINKRIMECASDRQKFFGLMQDLRKSPDDLNAVNVVTSIHTIAKNQWKLNGSANWLMDTLSNKVAEIGPRELPNIVWALSHLPDSHRSKVLDDITAHTSYHLRDLNLVSLASVLRGFAHMRVSWDILWSSAAIEITQRSSELCPVSFSNILWALGVVQRRCTQPALPSLCLYGAKTTSQMNATDIGSCLWAATRLDIRHRPFVSGMIERADDLAETFDEIGLVRVMQALAYFKDKDAALLSKFCRIIVSSMESMSKDNVARIADAVSGLHCDSTAFPDVADLRRLTEKLCKTNTAVVGTA